MINAVRATAVLKDSSKLEGYLSQPGSSLDQADGPNIG